MSANKAPAFQFYASDFFSSTLEMTNEEVGAYIRLLCHQWINGGLNKDINKLENVVKGLSSVWPNISHKFIEYDDGKLRNPRLEEVRRVQLEYREKQAMAGRMGAQKRWHSDPNSKNIALQSSSSSSSSTSKKFVAPTVDEVRQYCNEKRYNIDPEYFVSYYEANGWMRGKTKIKSWKQCLTTWAQRDKQKQQGNEKTLKKGDYL